MKQALFLCDIAQEGEYDMGWTEYRNVLDSWFGYSEARGQDDIIIDIYNSQRVESYKMSHQDPWCHATISAAGYQSGNQGKCLTQPTARMESTGSRQGDYGQADMQETTLRL